MLSSKFTKRLYKGAVASAEALDKLAGKVVTVIAVKHVDTMFKEAMRVEDKAEEAWDAADILEAAAGRTRTEAIALDFKADRLMRDAEQEALELGVSLSRWE
jgi:hypothetical protein